MKYLVAIIKPFRLEAVRAALTDISIEGMTVSEVRGFGRQKGHKEIYRGSEYDTQMVPKLKIEIAAEDGLAMRAVEAIEAAAKTDSIGDGKIFVIDLQDSRRIRTGEVGVLAL